MNILIQRQLYAHRAHHSNKISSILFADRVQNCWNSFERKIDKICLNKEIYITINRFPIQIVHLIIELTFISFGLSVYQYTSGRGTYSDIEHLENDVVLSIFDTKYQSFQTLRNKEFRKIFIDFLIHQISCYYFSFV